MRSSGGTTQDNTNEGTLGVNMKIGLKRGLIRGMVGARVTINSMQNEEQINLGVTWRSTQAALREPT